MAEPIASTGILQLLQGILGSAQSQKSGQVESGTTDSVQTLINALKTQGTTNQAVDSSKTTSGTVDTSGTSNQNTLANILSQLTGTQNQVTNQTSNTATTGSTSQNQVTNQTSGTATTGTQQQTSATTSQATADIAGLQKALQLQLAGVTPDQIAAIYTEGSKAVPGLAQTYGSALGANTSNNSAFARGLETLQRDLAAQVIGLNAQQVNAGAGTAASIAGNTRTVTETGNVGTTTGQNQQALTSGTVGTTGTQVQNQATTTAGTTGTTTNQSTNQSSNTAVTGSTTQQQVQNLTDALKSLTTGSTTSDQTQNQQTANSGSTASQKAGTQDAVTSINTDNLVPLLTTLLAGSAGSNLLSGTDWTKVGTGVADVAGSAWDWISGLFSGK